MAKQSAPENHERRSPNPFHIRWERVLMRAESFGYFQPISGIDRILFSKWRPIYRTGSLEIRFAGSASIYASQTPRGCRDDSYGINSSRFPAPPTPAGLGVPPVIVIFPELPRSAVPVKTCWNVPSPLSVVTKVKAPGFNPGMVS